MLQVLVESDRQSFNHVNGLEDMKLWSWSYKIEDVKVLKLAHRILYRFV